MQLPSKNYANNFLTFIILLICFTTCTIAQINWQQTNGPYGAAVYALEVSGTNLFAGTYGGGIFLSTNNGTSWSAVNNGLTNTYVYSLALNGVNLFAGTEGGVFLSTDNGASWSAVNNRLPSTYIYSLIFNGTNLFAGTYGGVFLSTDNGSSWSQVSTGLTNTNVHTLVVSGANLFAGTFGGGIFRSTDNGLNWSAVNTGLTNTYIYSFILSGANLFAGTDDGLYLSTNNGSSWSAINTGVPNSSIYNFALNGSNLFAGTGSGVFLSTNNGSSWTAVNSGLTTTNVWSLAVSGTNLFAGTYAGGVFLSTNNGSSWSTVNTGLINTFVGALTVSGTNIFAGLVGGVFLSTNNGLSWTSVNTGLTSTYVCALTVSGTNIFAGLVGGVFLSTNNGSTWTSVNTGLTDANIRTLAVNGTNLFTGTNGGGVFLSTNSGTSWKAINTGLTDINVNTLAISGTNLFAGTLGGGVFLSTDNGSSWSAVNTGLANTDVRALAVNGTNLFAGTLGGVFLSTNNGSSWNAVNTGLTNTIVYALAVRGTNLFAGTMYDGIFLSTNNGSSWSSVNTGLTRNYILSLAFSGTNLLAGTYGGGVFMSTIQTMAAPTITSFTPTSGPIGTTVTITGTNLNPAGTNNVVYFGAVKAQVLSSSSTQLTVTVPSGTTYQPITITDITTGLTASSAKPFTITFPSSQIVDVTSFASQIDFIAGVNANSVVITDVDGDGKPDLVVLNSSDNTISIFRNTSTSGTITASSFAPAVNFTTGNSPNSIAVGDVDGDGKPDLVVTNEASNTVSIFRNTSTPGSITTGSFAPKVDLTTGTVPICVAIADLDGDGKPDLVVANNMSNSVSIFRNTSSSGSITTSSFSSKVDLNMTGVYPIHVVINDIDGDGKPELVVEDFSNKTFSVSRNICSSGTTSFAPKVDFTTGVDPKDIALGDIDGDGKPDVVITNVNDNTVSVFRNTSVSGSITASSFAPGVRFTTGNSPNNVAIGDIDGDGKPDLTIANVFGYTVSVLKNTSVSGSITASSFASKVDIATSLGSTPYYVAIGDVDGDGKPDVVVANSSSNTISILRNMMGGSSPHPTITSFTPTHNALNVAKNTNITVTFNTDINQSTLNNSTIKINSSLTGLHPAAFSYNSSTKTATITPNTQFKVGELVAVALTSKIKSLTGDSLTNGYSSSFTVKTNASSGLFYESSTAGVGNYPWDVTVADFDNDGDIDAAIANNGSNSVSILKNDGNGSFTLSSTLTGLAGPVGIKAADYDGDGAIDLAVANSTSGTVSIFKNDGAGTFTLSSTIKVGTNPRYIAAADINGDGAIDLAVPNDGTNTVTILKNNGTGTFTTGQIINVDARPAYIMAADIDNDGYIDFVVSHYGNVISILHNDGSGMFTSTSFESVGAYAVADIDGDGYVDIMIMDDATNTVSVLKNNGSGTFTKISSAGVGNTPWQATAADLDGDGNIDVCVGNNYGNNVSILKNNGSGILTQTSLVSVGSYPGSIASADVDGNGTIDLIVANSQSGNISILKNRSSSATINTSSSILSFGSVSVGSSKSEYLKICNDGTDSSLIISNITSSNSAFTVNRTSLTIVASGCDSILITFLPITKGMIFNDSLILISNDVEKPNAKVSLTGSSTFNQPKVTFTLNLGGPIYGGISILGDNAMYAIASGDAIYRMNAAGSVAYMLQVAGDIRSSSSIAYDTTVYIASSDRNLYAFSEKGNSLWPPLPTGGVLTATPTIDSISNRVYIGVSNHNFIAVNRLSGAVAWNYFVDSEIRNSAVITSDRKLVFTTQKGTLYGFDLNNLSLATPSWQIALPDTAPSSIALDNQGYIYVGTGAGRLLKISIPTNQQPSIIWQVSLGQAIVGSPVIDAGGTLYTGSLDENLYAVDIQSGAVKWAFSTKGAIRSTPALSDAGNIFVANDSGEVISLDTSKNIRWYYKTSSAIAAPLLYYKSTLYIGTLGNQVIALSDIVDSSQSISLPKSDSSPKIAGKPVWATFQGNNQRTGMFSSFGTTTGIKNSSSMLPIDYTLMQNYPNPFNPSTTIQFALPKEGRVSLKIFNILGKHIATILDGFQSAGYHEVTVNFDSFSSGIYFYQMRVGSFIETKKMMLMK